MASGSLYIDIPACDPDGLFFGPTGSAAATPSAVAAPQSPPLLAAVFSVLQFGAIVPPLSPWPGVHRALPGYRYERGRLEGPVTHHGKPEWSDVELRGMGVDAQATLIERVIDPVLQEKIGSRQDVVVLFSGGVDSGFLASRLRSLGYRDALLLNYAFSEDDEESALAASVAKQLGMRFERILASETSPDPLESPGTIYPQPFADHSVVPTSDFAYAVLDRLGPGMLVLDGTGADGGFGLGAKIRTFQQMRRLPAWVLQFAGRQYQDRLWQTTGVFERVLRVLSRLGQMPLLAALIAQNPLAGKWYSASPAQEVYDALERWIEPLSTRSLASRVVAADLALVCANVFAQKARPILMRSGCEVCYPFMSQPVVSLAKAAIDSWPVTESKSPLKHSLSKVLPAHMVYRPKSGFADPAGEMFFRERFLQHLRATTEEASPLAGFIQTRYVRDCCDLLVRRRHLPAQTLNMLWAITFTDRWYRTAVPGQAPVV